MEYIHDYGFCRFQLCHYVVNTVWNNPLNTSKETKINLEILWCFSVIVTLRIFWFSLILFFFILVLYEYIELCIAQMLENLTQCTSKIFFFLGHTEISKINRYDFVVQLFEFCILTEILKITSFRVLFFRLSSATVFVTRTMLKILLRFPLCVVFCGKRKSPSVTSLFFYWHLKFKFWRNS